MKKVKHVVQYGVFAAYHLALETSFLADEGASLPELPLKSPITVALPDKPSSVERSISTFPGFSVMGAREHGGTEPIDGHKTERTSSGCIDSIDKSLVVNSTGMHNFSGDAIPSRQDMLSSHNKYFLPNSSCEEDDKKGSLKLFQYEQEVQRGIMVSNNLISDSFYASEPPGQVGIKNNSSASLSSNYGVDLEPPNVKHDNNNNNIQADMVNSKDDFPSSTSDHQSILVFLSIRCVWKGTVCDRSHLVRIKYYGSSDKPLGRFLRDQLFDQVLFDPLVVIFLSS